VVLDPTPAATTVVPAPPAPAQAAATTTTTSPPQNAVLPNQAVRRAVALPVPIRLPRHGAINPWWVALFALSAAGGAAATPFGAAATRRAIRRKRRHRGGPQTSAAGAWLDVLDALARAGADPGPAATSGEVVALVGRSFGPDLTPPVVVVARLSDRALFDAGASLEGWMAGDGWLAAKAFGRLLRGRLAWSQRIRGALRSGPRPPTRLTNSAKTQGT
jgi:hypothetical protein